MENGAQATTLAKNTAVPAKGHHMEQIRISAKDLGALAMPGFCPRCFWITRHAAKLPFQIFPGIFSSIDSYSKKITNRYYEGHRELVHWFAEQGLIGEPVKVPHHSKYNVLDEETGVLLTGMPDEILHLADGSYAILDYKTARFTAAQDAMHPVYDVQLNAYAYIGERLEFNPVSRMMLVYYEPVTDITVHDVDLLVHDHGFQLGFAGKMLEVARNTARIPGLLRRVRELVDLPRPPAGREDCADCRALNELVHLLAPAKGEAG
jgi:hypothetical protein